MNEIEELCRHVVKIIPENAPSSSTEFNRPSFAAKTTLLLAADEIARLTAENAELKARLEKAVELPFFQKDGEVIVLIYKNKDGIVLIEKYIEDEYYNGKRGKEAAEARLAKLKGGDKQ